MHKTLIGKPLGKWSLGRPKRWKDNIMMDLWLWGWEWTDMARIVSTCGLRYLQCLTLGYCYQIIMRSRSFPCISSHREMFRINEYILMRPIFYVMDQTFNYLTDSYDTWHGTATLLCWLIDIHFKSRGSWVGIATDYGLDDRMIRFRIPAGDGNFSLLHRV
jgi:hypothetical protein